jgi:hypothetical protein
VTCGSNPACLHGICGSNSNCCALGGCSTVGPCAYTGCAPGTGMCMYPGTSTGCGVGMACDGAGNCKLASGQPCVMPTDCASGICTGTPLTCM